MTWRSGSARRERSRWYGSAIWAAAPWAAPRARVITCCLPSARPGTMRGCDGSVSDSTARHQSVRHGPVLVRTADRDQPARHRLRCVAVASRRPIPCPCSDHRSRRSLAHTAVRDVPGGGPGANDCRRSARKVDRRVGSQQLKWPAESRRPLTDRTRRRQPQRARIREYPRLAADGRDDLAGVWGAAAYRPAGQPWCPPTELRSASEGYSVAIAPGGVAQVIWDYELGTHGVVRARALTSCRA